MLEKILRKFNFVQNLLSEVSQLRAQLSSTEEEIRKLSEKLSLFESFREVYEKHLLSLLSQVSPKENISLGGIEERQVRILGLNDQNNGQFSDVCINGVWAQEKKIAHIRWSYNDLNLDISNFINAKTGENPYEIRRRKIQEALCSCEIALLDTAGMIYLSEPQIFEEFRESGGVVLQRVCGSSDKLGGGRLNPAVKGVSRVFEKGENYHPKDVLKVAGFFDDLAVKSKLVFDERIEYARSAIKEENFSLALPALEGVIEDGELIVELKKLS